MEFCSRKLVVCILIFSVLCVIFDSFRVYKERIAEPNIVHVENLFLNAYESTRYDKFKNLNSECSSIYCESNYHPNGCLDTSSWSEADKKFWEPVTRTGFCGRFLDNVYINKKSSHESRIVEYEHMRQIYSIGVIPNYRIDELFDQVDKYQSKHPCMNNCDYIVNSNLLVNEDTPIFYETYVCLIPLC